MTRRQALALICGLSAGACASPNAPPPEMPSPTSLSPTATSRPTAVPAAPRPTVTPVPATAAPVPTATPQAVVLPGVDVLLRDGSSVLEGKRVGLVTNATGRTRSGQSSIDALFNAADWKLTALFSPEHGIRGEAAAGQNVDSSHDPQTGLPVFSLYGDTTRPTDAMLKGLDVLVYDVQDVGTRTYTYISTLLEVMRAAASHTLPVLVLDRPDPVGGDHVDGNVLDPRFASFVGPAPLAMRYGLTAGELSQWFNAELKVAADLHVVPMEGWQRGWWYDQTGLAWVNPSPNIQSVSAAALYPGTVLFEGTNVSEGRGTPTPFEWIGAPWLDALPEIDTPGVRLTLVDRTPDASAAKYPGILCHGVHIEITDRQQLRPMDLAVHLLAALPAGKLQLMSATFDGLAGTGAVRKAIQAGQSAAEIVAAWQTDLDAFKATRERYLLY